MAVRGLWARLETGRLGGSPAAEGRFRSANEVGSRVQFLQFARMNVYRVTLMNYCRARRNSSTSPSPANTMFPSHAPSHTGNCPDCANIWPKV